MKINKESVKQSLPTVSHFLERRRKAARNRLPKHLRPPTLWPIWFQMAVNAAVFIAVLNVLINKDEYATEAAPAITLVICLMFLIYTITNALRIRVRYQKIKGQRLAKLNLGLTALAVLTWAIGVAGFLS